MEPSGAVCVQSPAGRIDSAELSQLPSALNGLASRLRQVQQRLKRLEDTQGDPMGHPELVAESQDCVKQHRGKQPAQQNMHDIEETLNQAIRRLEQIEESVESVKQWQRLQKLKWIEPESVQEHEPLGINMVGTVSTGQDIIMPSIALQQRGLASEIRTMAQQTAEQYEETIERVYATMFANAVSFLTLFVVVMLGAPRYVLGVAAVSLAFNAWVYWFRARYALRQPGTKWLREKQGWLLCCVGWLSFSACLCACGSLSLV